MEGAAPPTLSGLARRMVRRPPSISDIVMLLRYSEDYGWFVNLTHQMFPKEADGVLGLPRIRDRVGQFLDLVQERHFPLDRGLIEYVLEEEDKQSCTWLRRGIPFRLVGYSYDDFHEMWSGFGDGISALALLTKSSHKDDYGSEEGIRVSWLEAAAVQIPQATLDRIPAGGIDVDLFWRALRGTRFKGAAAGASWIWSQTGNFYLDCNLEDGGYDGLCDPWEDASIVQSATEAWREADKVLAETDATVAWLERDLAAHFAELLDFVLPRLPEAEEKENNNE